MSSGYVCRCEESKKPLAERAWRITQFRSNRSAFNGNRRTSSDYSALRCQRCRAIWRTKSAYVDQVPIETAEERRKNFQNEPEVT